MQERGIPPSREGQECNGAIIDIQTYVYRGKTLKISDGKIKASPGLQSQPHARGDLAGCLLVPIPAGDVSSSSACPPLVAVASFFCFGG